jgi:hypothetical protein
MKKKKMKIQLYQLNVVLMKAIKTILILKKCLTIDHNTILEDKSIKDNKLRG